MIETPLEVLLRPTVPADLHQPARQVPEVVVRRGLRLRENAWPVESCKVDAAEKEIQKERERDVRMCTQIYTCVYIYIYIHTNMFIYIYIHSCIHTSVCFSGMKLRAR